MGRKSQVIGASAESLVDDSLRAYRAELAWSKTYPEVKFFGRGVIRPTGKATPDRAISLKCLGGRLLWLEIKSWEAKDRETLSSRIHQYWQMKEFCEQGGALGFYLVCWRWRNSAPDWRLHDVLTLPFAKAPVFERQAGLSVPAPAPDEWPRWLPILKSNCKTA